LLRNLWQTFANVAVRCDPLRSVAVNSHTIPVRVMDVAAGAGKGSEIAVTSSLFVETVEKKPGVVQGKRFHGDASRVVASGNGLKKGFSGRAANFTLDIKDAGTIIISFFFFSNTK